MGKFYCTCGFVSSNVSFPTSHEAHLISDVDLDEHTNYTARTISRAVPVRRVVECAGCGLLWIAPKNNVGSFLSFMPMGERLGLVPADENYRPPSASDATIEGKEK